jgi:hypothetical protein
LGVGSPTHPVMPNLVVLWEMSPLRGGVRAGARLWARGPARRGWVAIGPKPKPRGAGEAPGPLQGQGEGRRPAQGYFLSLIISRAGVMGVTRNLEAFDSRWVPPVGGAPSRRTSTSTRRCVRHQRCNDWVTKPSA